MSKHPSARPSRLEREVESLTRANPAYRDTPLGRGRAMARDRPAFGGRPIPRRSDRPLMWRLLGVPAPRELVRALLIDGYPRSLHRWAFGRVGSSIGWTCAAGGVLAAAAVLWFVLAAGMTARSGLMSLLALAILLLVVAFLRLMPVLSAIRYARTWNRGMGRATGKPPARRD